MNRGGAESMIMNYYRNINRDKIQFDFLVHRKEKGAFDDEIERLGGKIFRVTQINPFFPSSYYNELRAFFKKYTNYKIIHSHLNTFSCFPLKIAHEFNIPFRIAHAHTATEKINFLDLFHPHHIKETLKKLTKAYLKKNILTYTTQRMSCGKKAGEWLFGPNEDFIILNNAIDAKKFIYNESIAKEYRKEFGYKNELIIGHIGNFSDAKNMPFLVQIFDALLKENENCRLLLVGDGPQKQKFESDVKKLTISHRVNFLGTRNDISNLCNLFDIFVFPSLYEGLPVTLIETQASGLKVFASKTITSDVALTTDLTFLPLSASPQKWAEQIIQQSSYKRKNNYELIRSKGYDIMSNITLLENFYLSKK
tara:strand:- start:10798 stop:11895 length:1098 start_codon:yes stop_codon:yes gene_type:complete